MPTVDSRIKDNWKRHSVPELLLLLEEFYLERNAWEKLAQERYIRLGIVEVRIKELHDYMLR